MNKKNIIWAPWRKKYITGETEPEECIFCSKAASNKDRENYLILRGKTSFAMLNLYPYNNGHILIAPYRHTGDPLSLTPEESLEIFDILKIYIKIINEKMRPEGFNMGMNIGRSAGAGIEDHIHMHLLPRWTGDTNFMPAFGGAKVISESLDSVYDKLKNEFD